MAENDSLAQVSIKPVERPINLIPVGLKEAALDSPTFRATTLHFADQVDIVERWLEGYVKAAVKLISEVSQFESAVNGFLNHSTPPTGLSEAAVDHDYTLLAMRRYGEGAREYWNQTLKGMKKFDTTAVDPVRSFLNVDLRNFKEAKRTFEYSQKSFDGFIARYLAQSKMKEASALREDAFQLYEARRAYLNASMDFGVAAPLLRSNLDKLMVKIFTEQWKEMRTSRDASATTFSKMGNEMDRVRGWSKEMENSERAFNRELMTAKKKIEENACQMIKPSRDLADYETSTVPYLGTGAGGANSLTAKTGSQERGEKQGWLFMKTLVGKPTRTVWSRRWFFVKNGIFGWLIQGPRSGGVEESEKIGVLLCGVKPAFQEERRFCFEVKTKDTSIILQAETQAELSDWISSFEVAKRKALDDPTSVETSPLSPGIDPAFAITPPISPEFAAKTVDNQASEDAPSGLAPPEREGTGVGLVGRASFDVNANRRVTSLEREPGEGSRDHAARIIQKLDLHKRSAAPTQTSQSAAPMGGGIASLISASHNIFPVGPGALPPASDNSNKLITANMPTSSLAPSTLANPPAPTNLSNTAIIISSDRGVSLGGRSDGSGMPGGLMANLWGSSHWGYVNRLGDESKSGSKQTSDPPRDASHQTVDDVNVMDRMADETQKEMGEVTLDGESPASLRHRKTMSATSTTNNQLPAKSKSLLDEKDEYPNYYPLPLKAQHAQFRMLFPSVPLTEKLVLVFRATWNPNEQQEFPGRVYVTEKEIYFYSNHLGLVLITGVSLTSISEVTSAPGRDCDFLYLLLNESGEQGERTRITVRVFLDSLKLLQRRLSFLVDNAGADQPASLEDVIKTLIKMEVEEPKRSSSAESWEDVTYDADENGGGEQGHSGKGGRNMKASIRIDGDLYRETAKTGRDIQKFQLPRHPVVYAPQGMQASTTREFNVSAKAIFHVMFGDKSAVFQVLYSNRWADKIIQTPWTKQGSGVDGKFSRQFSSQGHATPLADVQVIDIMNDHLCYVVTHNKRPWRLPYSNQFHLTTKLVITHSAKSRCRLAVFQSISWIKVPPMSYLRNLVDKQALNSLEADALDLTNVVMDQVAKLGMRSKTNKAIEIFGNIGTQSAVPQIDTGLSPNLGGSATAKRERARRPVGIVSLVMSDLTIRLLGFFSMGFDFLIALGKGAIGVCTAHTLLVALLVFSALSNSWFGYRDGLTWWHERSAGLYMRRLGVKPEPTMSRALYLTDIEDLVKPIARNDTFPAPIWASAESGDVKTCRSTFEDILSGSASTVAFIETGRRLHRSREALAKYRHDLVVAMRVVNRVEKDVVLAEWEDWVQGEERKCARVEHMLAQAKQVNSSRPTTSDRNATEELDRELGAHFAEYCASCRDDLAIIGKDTSLI